MRTSYRLDMNASADCANGGLCGGGLGRHGCWLTGRKWRIGEVNCFDEGEEGLFLSSNNGIVR